MEISTIILLFAIGFIANFIGSMIGGGGLISIPSLIFIGLSPQVAIATDRFSSIGQSTSIFKYHKASKINYKLILPLSIITIIGTIIGSNILINFDKSLLTKIIGIIILLLLPLVLMNKSGLINKKSNYKQNLIGYVLYFFIVIYGAFIGAGTGILTTIILIFFFGLTYLESNGNFSILWLIISLFSSILFAFQGLIRYDYGIVLLAGSLIGGYAGAHTALKKGDKFIKILFIVLILISSIKLIFF
jgi:uncharacterized membrane protein YfcA